MKNGTGLRKTLPAIRVAESSAEVSSDLPENHLREVPFLDYRRNTRSPMRKRPGPSCTTFCPNITSPPCFRYVAKVRSGSLPRSPVAWSVVVTTQRPHGFTTRMGMSLTSIRCQSSSAYGWAPATTRLGRNRFIGSG